MNHSIWMDVGNNTQNKLKQASQMNYFIFYFDLAPSYCLETTWYLTTLKCKKTKMIMVCIMANLTAY